MTAQPAPMRDTAQGQIGPNAILRLNDVLLAVEGDLIRDSIFQAAGLSRYLTSPPSKMVPQAEVAALHSALHARLGDSRARTLGWLAGRRTAEYLLANRIPRMAQMILRLLPAALSIRMLAALIRLNAWTFVGAGRLSWRFGAPAVVTITACPLVAQGVSAEPWCDYFAGTFETLFAALVNNGVHVVETQCLAKGDAVCVFELRMPGRLRAGVRLAEV